MKHEQTYEKHVTNRVTTTNYHNNFIDYTRNSDDEISSFDDYDSKIVVDKRTTQYNIKHLIYEISAFDTNDTTVEINVSLLEYETYTSDNGRIREECNYEIKFVTISINHKQLDRSRNKFEELEIMLNQYLNFKYSLLGESRSYKDIMKMLSKIEENDEMIVNYIRHYV